MTEPQTDQKYDKINQIFLGSGPVWGWTMEWGKILKNSEESIRADGGKARLSEGNDQEIKCQYSGLAVRVLLEPGRRRSALQSEFCQGSRRRFVSLVKTNQDV